MVTGIIGPLPRLGEPSGVDASAGTGVGALSSSAGGGSRPCPLPPRRCSGEVFLLFTPCRGPRPGLVFGRVLFGVFCHGHNHGLLHRLLATGLLDGILVGRCRLGCPQASNVTRINIRGHTIKKGDNEKFQKKQKSRRKCRRQVLELIGWSSCASL